MSESRGAAKLPLQQMREPGRNFELYLSENITQVTVNGIAGVTGGPALSHLDFFVATEVRPDGEYGPREIRQITMRVLIPTAQLLEGLANLVASLGSEMDALAASAHQNAEAIARHAERLKAMSAR